MSAYTNGAAAAALTLAQSGAAGPGELIHIAPGASVRDLDRAKWFTWRRGGVVRAWADPGHTVRVFRLQGHWCHVQNIFVVPA